MDQLNSKSSFFLKNFNIVRQDFYIECQTSWKTYIFHGAPILNSQQNTPYNQAQAISGLNPIWINITTFRKGVDETGSQSG